MMPGSREAMHQPKRGRPQIASGQPTVNANVRVPTTAYDRACVRAIREGVSVSELLRRGLAKLLDEEDGDDS